MLLARFQSQMASLIPDGARFLLAVSGGRDSVALEHLCHRAGLDYHIAHCNFNLRPGDCDRDEAFVRNLAQRHGVACHVRQFDTRGYASMHRLSIEEAARDLRYAFFDELRKSCKLDVILTAHHRDDSIETFFLNLMRGTGIAGLHGIPARNGHIVRPMLTFSRGEIDAYMSQHGLEYVEDETNSSLQYRRNQVRHQLLPLLRQLAPGIDAAMQRTMSYLSDVETIYGDRLDEIRKQVFTSVEKEAQCVEMEADARICEDAVILDFELLRGLRPLPTLLFEMLRPYGFNAAQTRELLSSIDNGTGQRFRSATHTLCHDRGKLIIVPNGKQFADDDASCGDARAADAFSISFSSPPSDLASLKAMSGPRCACFDADRVAMPLSMRHWRRGDRFFPYGMQGSQLLSDYFSDHKYSPLDKRRQLLLVDANDQILWVVGRRTDRRAMITDRTGRMLVVSLPEGDVETCAR